MASAVRYSIYGNTFHILPQRALFWEEEKALIVADLHLGKTGHFRKAGIAVPQTVYKNDLHRLFSLVQQYNVEKLIIAGDMFHSVENKEIELFIRWRNDLEWLDVFLIKGNHDILRDDFYKRANIRLFDEQLLIGKFCFVHDQESCNDETENEIFYFCGHIHPGVLITGGSRQALRFACYHFTRTHAILPAFSAFTGLYTIKPKAGEKVFAIVENEVMEV
ncbi:ligase-associated DNA damage response endonuclease PdeM [Danxiaibacter flavus]|uniref:Ligase-associated DNA damage response endonuclease PdeM n=1 Tax=Danxiaibacter flavus TaxID=3049108 RepID=A0ABV3ZE40_9BACT|nr:ligase-associated DNA damage response endonuclease PdeM [Chitinophagaceae bacterium DXS]